MAKKCAAKKEARGPEVDGVSVGAASERPFGVEGEREAAFVRWLAGARARGMERGGMVWELHVVQGRGSGGGGAAAGAG